MVYVTRAEWMSAMVLALVLLAVGGTWAVGPWALVGLGLVLVVVLLVVVDVTAPPGSDHQGGRE